MDAEVFKNPLTRLGGTDVGEAPASLSDSAPKRVKMSNPRRQKCAVLALVDPYIHPETNFSKIGTECIEVSISAGHQ